LDGLARWAMIDKTLGLNCPDPAETYSNSPHLYVELDIPTDVQGSIGAPKKSPVKRTASGGRNGDEPAQQRNSDRQRRRTRGGQSATGHADANGNANADTDGSTPAADAGSGDGTRARRRRRRPRKSAGATAGAN
jgi:hypothetical protein